MAAGRVPSLLCAAGLLLAAATVSAAWAAQRVALVIGNAAYNHAPQLANPLNDAGDIGVALAFATSGTGRASRPPGPAVDAGRSSGDHTG